MTRPIRAEHWNDADGNPAGGITQGRGFIIAWQNGPLAVDGERKEPTGAFVEDIIRSAIDRIEHYQTSKFRCDENVKTLQHLRRALESQRSRTVDRELRGVEGTHQV